jgi:hypothetical protein
VSGDALAWNDRDGPHQEACIDRQLLAALLFDPIVATVAVEHLAGGVAHCPDARLGISAS